ncbi:MAG: DUF86 domain-containing protein [Nanoarchaeota archaeon]|nr:DUF86 domain-containing protein [Nanoarchaeota archaeon]
MTGAAKDPMVFVRHILDSIVLVESYMKGVNKAKFLADNKVQDAVIRRLEIIGEAAKNVPSGFAAKNVGVPWSEMARMRDKLIHKYFGVDLDLTFDVVKKDLPNLKKELQKALKDKD